MTQEFVISVELADPVQLAMGTEKEFFYIHGVVTIVFKKYKVLLRNTVMKSIPNFPFILLIKLVTPDSDECSNSKSASVLIRT